MAKVKSKKLKKIVRKPKPKTAEQLHRIRVRAGKKAAKTRKRNIRAKKIAENEARISAGAATGPFSDPKYDKLGEYKLQDKSGVWNTFYSHGIQRLLNMAYNYGYTQIVEIVDIIIDKYGYEALKTLIQNNYFRAYEDRKHGYGVLEDLYSAGKKDPYSGKYKSLGVRLGQLVKVLADYAGVDMRKKGKRRY